MAESSANPQLQQDSNYDNLELNMDLERMIENVESLSVQLTWMAYDMVALRTNPDLGACKKKLEEAYYRCRAAVFGDQETEQIS